MIAGLCRETGGAQPSNARPPYATTSNLNYEGGEEEMSQ